MTAPVQPGKRLALMVAGAGLGDDVLNEILGARGFQPVVAVGSLAELTVRMRIMQPLLVILPVDATVSRADLAQFEAELRRTPGTAAIATAPVKDADAVIAAMRAGILEFLVTPADAAEVRAAIGRVLSVTAGGAALGQVITVYAAKGGLGTSTIAASLAWELARRQGKSGVSLADFTTTGAGLRVMLNLTPTYDLGSIATQPERIDRDFVRSVMVPHVEGVSVLAASDEVDAIDVLDAKTAGRLFDVLRQEFPFTVVDTDHHFSETTLAALDAADRILLVTQLEVSALRSTQRTLGVLGRLGYPTEKLLVVVNRRSDRDRITVADAEEVLRRPITARLPNDYNACADAITAGQFVQRHAPHSSLVASFNGLAGLLAGSLGDVQATEAAVRSETSRWSRLLGRR